MACAGSLSAQVPALPAVRLAVPPKIDGLLDDEAWKSAAKSTRFLDPITGREPADGAVAWIGFDRDAIYVAFECQDARPDQITAREVSPGAEMWNDDRVQFLIDPLHNRSESSLSSFTVNALGTQSESIAGGRTAKREWRGEWQAAVARTASGWTVEMRIPWKVLNYSGSGVRDMNVNFFRYQARTNVISEWANRGAGRRAEQNGDWKAVEAPMVEPPRLEHLAYVAPEWNGSRNRSDFRSGIDVRYRFTPLLTGVASLNPDFRNIEAQIAGIDFTRTERYLEDVRPFFTEGGSFFDLTPQFTFGRMFYSQRIDEFDFGAKVFGQVGDRLRIGALATQDGPGRHDVVTKVSQLLGPRGVATVYSTASDHPGVRNRTLGANIGNYWGNYGVEAQLASSEDRGVADSAGSYSLAYSTPRFFSILRGSWIEPDFNPYLAYVPFIDRRGWYSYNEHNNTYRSGPLKDLHADLFVSDYEHYDGSPDEKGFSIGTYMGFRSDHDLEIYLNRWKYNGVPDRTLFVRAGANRSNRFRRISVSYEGGRRENEDTQYLRFEGTYRTFRKIDLGLVQSVLDFSGRSEQTIATLGWEIDAARTLTGRFVQTDGKRNYYVAFRNAGFKGMEMFVIWGDPNAETFQRRLSVKLVWAF